MVIIEECEEKINDKKLVELIDSETYYELDFITEDWIIKRLYISKCDAPKPEGPLTTRQPAECS